MSEVEEFIDDFVNKGDYPDVIEKQFADGYCYHFAIILKNIFNRGEIVWAAPYGHIMWKDIDGVPYDIYGKFGSEYDYLIPISFLGEDLKDFTHRRSDIRSGATKERIQQIIDNYKESVKVA